MQEDQAAAQETAGSRAAPGAPQVAPTAKPAAAPPAPAPREDVAEQPEGFNLAGWQERARRHLRVSPHAIAGALHDVEPDAIVSEDELKRRLEEFAGRPGTEDIKARLEQEQRERAGEKAK